MLEWKEREHELNDQVALNDDATLEALRNCGLLKFFMCLGLRAQALLLQRMVAMWDFDSQHFVVGDQILEIEIEDIYFLNRLSSQGDPVTFGGQGGGGESVDSYVNDLCSPRTHKQGGKLLIKHVSSIVLRTILFIVTQLARSASAHLASKSQVVTSLRAIDGVVFNWCAGLLVTLKDQFTHCQKGWHKMFKYAYILACFSFSEGTIHASMDNHPIFLYERSNHVEMVGITLPSRRLETTTLY